MLISESRKWEEEYPVDVLAWVVMPDHLHLLISLSGEMSLSEVMRKLKGSTARILNTQSGESFWQQGFYDHALREEEDRKKVARCIVANPLRAGLVPK